LFLIRRVLRDGPATIFFNSSLGYVTCAALGGVIYAGLKKIKAFLVPGIWFISLVFMFNFASSSFTFYRPLVLFDRYLYPLLFPAVLIAAGFIDALVPRMHLFGWENWKRLLAAALMIGGVGFACIKGFDENLKKGIGSPVERIVSQMLSPEDELLTDVRTAWVLNYFWDYPEKTGVRDFEGISTQEVPPSVHVLINRDRIEFLQSAYGYAFPEFCENIPTHWILEWSGNRAELFRIP